MVTREWSDAPFRIASPAAGGQKLFPGALFAGLSVAKNGLTARKQVYSPVPGMMAKRLVPRFCLSGVLEPARNHIDPSWMSH
ncbi:protein of unknown function [Magnetospira sp. QH-2]|nr:protein of unknown function [Magnetospira sp. QH-2]